MISVKRKIVDFQRTLVFGPGSWKLGGLEGCRAFGPFGTAKEQTLGFCSLLAWL